MIESLGGLDALFLLLETEAMPMHVGSLHVYRRPAHVRGDLAEHFRRHLARRLHLSPVFTRRLADTPLSLTSPSWVESRRVDLDYHVQRVTLPAPGTRRELEQCAAELHSAVMDRHRPMWRFWVIEGLNEPDIVGFYAKVHHAAIDGKAGAIFAQAMLDVSETPRDVAPPSAPGAPRAGSVALLQSSLANQIRQSRRLLGQLPDLIKAGSSVAGGALGARLRSLRPHRDDDNNASGVLGTGPRTRLNASIDGGRSFATAESPLTTLKAITETFGGTLNDTLLAICAGALRSFLDEGGELPDEPLVAAVPVSLRASNDKRSNTQAAMFRVPLATHLSDPLERYAAILRATERMKTELAAYKSAIPTDFPSIGMPWLLPGLAQLYGRSGVADIIRPPANLVISNVPGPPMPLYLAGARMLTYWPASIVAHGLALNITVETYNGTMWFGIVGCRKAVPDVERLANHVRGACAELAALAIHASGTRKPPLTNHTRRH